MLAAVQKLFLHNWVGPAGDFFTDLGGHFLLAAALVCSLRKQARFVRLSLQDMYELRTAERTAARFAEGAAPQPDRVAVVDALSVSAWRHRLCTVAVAVLLPIVFALAATEFLVPYLALDEWHDIAGWAAAIGMALLVFTLIPFVLMGVGSR